MYTKGRRLSLLLGIFASVSLAQVSPHGPTSFTCRMCHVADSSAIRRDSTFDHTLTRYVLTDRHKKIECLSCHKALKFALQETQCMSCHPDVHKGELGETCAQCHVTQAWLGADMMRQHEKGRFLLTGAHEALPCTLCHTDGNFKLVFSGCQQCHEGQFQNTTSPGHVASNFTHDCSRCHSTKGWSPATFDHGTTHFPLTGAHTAVPCRSCHENGNYQLQYVDCFPCHQVRFKQSLNPNHVVANFPHDCYPCHSTTAWRPSTFTHDQQNFRIFNGKHRNKWSACSDCHQNSSNFAFYSCLACHREDPMNQTHVSVRSYSYASPACYSCHRDA